MKVFIGGAWPYANNSLHVGHLAALLPGDIIARYYRKNGADVIYVSGTDSHGTPITLRAKKENINPEEIALKYHKEFQEVFEKLGFSYDLYTKTFDPYHKLKVGEYFKIIYDNGYIYELEEEQDFCEKCNEYLSDREIEGTCPICGGNAKGDQCDDCLSTFNSKELKNKVCKYCGTKVNFKKNKHLYFELSKFQEQIEKLVEDNKDIWRFNAVNESLKYLKDGLRDRAATRQLSWGVDTPIPGFEDKKIYVWIEAVLGYLTAGERYCEENGIDWADFIKESDDLRTYFVHGKDNIPFHTIIFPALLLALKLDIKLPEYIVSSEYLNVNDEKISKSKGNGITVQQLVDNYAADTIRYYITSSSPEKKDANFSFDEFVLSHNKHLVGEYGNFVNRNLSFLVKKFDGNIPSGIIDSEVEKSIKETYVTVGNAIEKGELKFALSQATKLVQLANKYYDDKKPWIQVKENILEFNNTTATCVSLIVNLANLLEPFLPNSTKKIFNILGVSDNKWQYISTEGITKITDLELLFQRIEQ